MSRGLGTRSPRICSCFGSGGDTAPAPHAVPASSCTLPTPHVDPVSVNGPHTLSRAAAKPPQRTTSSKDTAAAQGKWPKSATILTSRQRPPPAPRQLCTEAKLLPAPPPDTGKTSVAGPAAALTEAEVKRPTAPLLGSQRDGSRQRSARPRSLSGCTPRVWRSLLPPSPTLLPEPRPTRPCAAPRGTCN